MARRTALVKLLTDLRAETRSSLNPAHNSGDRDRQVNLLQRTQERLWEDFTWPHLRVEREQFVQNGQRFYDTPEDIAVDHIEKIEFFVDGVWCDLRSGIDGHNYTAFNSELDERAWPPRRWRISEDEMVELWPIPDTDFDPVTRYGVLKFTGTRNLKPLVADTDVSDLDGRLLVLFAAAETLAADGSKDAQLKLDAANKLYAKLRAGLTPRTKFRMFGIGEPRGPRRLIARYRPT